MKLFLGKQLSYMLEKNKSRNNLKAFAKFLVFVASVIVVHSVVFHFIMVYEGREYSWLTGFYWTMTVMSTLGFGDITFSSDLGKLFSVLVLLSGIFLLLILLPFGFIRFFYLPLMEAHARTLPQRHIPPETTGHVLFTSWQEIERGLAERLTVLGIPYYVIVPDPVKANELHIDGVPVITGDLDATKTYENAAIHNAKAIFLSDTDAANTGIILTVREIDTEVPIITLAEEDESVDLLELAGATHVLPLKRRLGEQLANRVQSMRSQVHIIGKMQNLLIGEFPVHGTPLAGQTLQEIHLRRKTGANVVGIWKRGQMQPVRPDTVVDEWSLPVVVCTMEQMDSINRMVRTSQQNTNPVLVIGGSKVGRATAKELRENGLKVHLIEHDPEKAAKAEQCADKVFMGEAADREVLEEAGLDLASSVVLTTNDDATNAYLCIYFRKLKPSIRIVSRITYERNIETIHRAGADFALSYSSLGQELVLAILQNREFIFLGSDIDFHILDVPPSIAGTTIRESNIGARTGLNIIAIDFHNQTSIAGPDTKLPPKARLIALGTAAQVNEMHRIFD